MLRPQLHRILVATAFAALVAGFFSHRALGAEAATKPNLVLIMADDLGFETIGANGGTSYATPVLDGLAAGGVRFDHCFVQPLCTPTRVQLMTGLYNVRNYINFGQMDPEATTFAHRLKPAGYATCIVGKWQLGSDPQLPAKFGFDEHCLWQHTRRPDRYKNPGLEVNGRERDYTSGEYGPELVNRYALEFIERKKDEPFFLYYPMILTHGPYDPTPDSPDYDAPARRGNRAAEGERRVTRREARQQDPHFKDMVQYMDKMIGRLVDKLDEVGIRENTLVIFIGDNGTAGGTRSMMGDRVVDGGKGKMNASGMHVPCIASWPGTIATGKVCSDLVDSTDFLPTLLEAAGVPAPDDQKLDGRSFLPQLKGQPGNPREWYYCWYQPRDAFVGEFAADHRFKLFRDGRLFDVVADWNETQPLDRDRQEGDAAAAVRKLQAALDQFADARPEHLRNAKPSAGAPE